MIYALLILLLLFFLLMHLLFSFSFDNNKETGSTKLFGRLLLRVEDENYKLRHVGLRLLKANSVDA